MNGLISGGNGHKSIVNGRCVSRDKLDISAEEASFVAQLYHYDDRQDHGPIPETAPDAGRNIEYQVAHIRSSFNYSLAPQGERAGARGCSLMPRSLNRGEGYVLRGLCERREAISGFV